jgi:hypothetical protein
MAKKKLEDHPIAAVFPLLPKAELKELAKDIDTNGLMNPILLYERKVLDGRNRYRAILTIPRMAEHLDSERDEGEYFSQYKGDDPIGHVISLNCYRRHLTVGQRAAIAVELANMKVGKPTSANWDNCPNYKVSQDQAAAPLRVSRKSVQRAKAVKDADPELHAKVKSGEVTLNAALKAVKPDPEPEPTPEPEISWTAPEVSGEEESPEAWLKEFNAVMEATRFHQAVEELQFKDLHILKWSLQMCFEYAEEQLFERFPEETKDFQRDSGTNSN